MNRLLSTAITLTIVSILTWYSIDLFLIPATKYCMTTGNSYIAEFNASAAANFISMLKLSQKQINLTDLDDGKSWNIDGVEFKCPKDTQIKVYDNFLIARVHGVESQKYSF